MARCPIEEKQSKLQSVKSKLDHNRNLLAKVQRRQQQLQEELQHLHEEHKTLSGTVADLETERKQLVGVVKTHLEQSDPRGDKNDNDQSEDDKASSSGWEADSETSVQAPTAKRTRRKSVQIELLRPRCNLPEGCTWDGDPASLDPVDFDTLWSRMKQVKQKRKDVEMLPQGGKSLSTSSSFGNLGDSHL